MAENEPNSVPVEAVDSANSSMEASPPTEAASLPQELPAGVNATALTDFLQTHTDTATGPNHPLTSAATTVSKPTDLNAYIEWAKTHLGVDFRDQAQRTRYETNIRNAATFFRTTPFAQQLQQYLTSCGADFNSTRHARLFTTTEEAQLSTKPYDSLLDKSFRLNVLWNRRFPEPPRRGWVKPDAWYSQINDLVRTTVVCTFIDGPTYLAERLAQLAGQTGTLCRTNFEARDEGYYAVHFYAKFKATVLTEAWGNTDAELECEIQLCTQLQEVVRQLTHKHYERTRLQEDHGEWKWEVTSERFKAGYLSHTMHLLESIILQLRDSAGGHSNGA